MASDYPSFSEWIKQAGWHLDSAAPYLPWRRPIDTGMEYASDDTLGEIYRRAMQKERKRRRECGEIMW